MTRGREGREFGGLVERLQVGKVGIQEKGVGLRENLVGFH